MPSGADLEYQRLLALSEAGSGAGLDGARLTQIVLSDPELGGGGGASAEGFDHGAVEGSVIVSADYALHEMELTGDTDITLDGEEGVVVVRITGNGLVTLTNATWDTDTEIEVAPGRFVAGRWPSGWYASALTEPPGGPVTPTGPTWNDLADTANDTFIIPNETGVNYRIGLTPMAPGEYDAWDYADGGGEVVVTAVAAPGGYSLIGDTEWSYSFSSGGVFAAVVTDTFVGANGTAIVGKATTTGGLTWQSNPGDQPDQWSIQGNRATYVPVGGAYDSDGIRIYTAPADPEGLRVTLADCQFGGTTVNYFLSLRFVYEEGGFGGVERTLTINLKGNGDITSADSGAIPLVLSGTLSGHVVAGVDFTVEIISTAVRILLDGVEVATGTLEGPANAKVAIHANENPFNVSFDTFTMEQSN